jgi:5-methylcytosine-specific restriction protein A
MKTHLLSWNPDKWNWTDIEESIQELNETGVFQDSWSCGTNKSIKPHDRLFLIRLGGKEPKGICASGYAVSDVYQDDHWSGEPDKKTNYIRFEYDILLNPEKEDILSMDYLKTNEKLTEQHWSTQNSGIQIRQNVAEELEKVLFDFTLKERGLVVKPDFVENTEKGLIEGAVRQITSNKYERNQQARKICIDKYGTQCSVCGFDFEKTYGEIGKDFIHVHHLQQVSTIKKEYEINPSEDLRPVCPNCHVMIHRKKIPLTIEELKRKIGNTVGNNVYTK